MALSKGASEVLAQDIRVFEGELAQLDTQILHLESRREALKYKLDLLRKAIGIDLVGPLPEMTDARDIHIQVNSASVAPVGLRALIRSVVQDSPKGFKPRDVYDELVKRGVPYEGKSDPVIRTAGEMWRMEKAGQLEKRGKQYFAPKNVREGG